DAGAEIHTGADAVVADVIGGIRVAIVASLAFVDAGPRARAGGVVAGARRAALVGGAGHADAVIDSRAGARGADVAGRVGIAVVARRAVVRERARAGAGRMIDADARDVAHA